MGVTINKSDLFSVLTNSENFPTFNPFVILHAEHKLIMVKDALQVGAEYEHEIEVIDCMDKGKNAFVLFRTNSYTAG